MRLVASRVVRAGGEIPRGAAMAASSALGGRAGAFLELRDESGTIGLGEASPLAPFHAESLDEVVSVLAGVHHALGELDGDDPFAMRALPDRFPAAIRSMGSARCAVETALADLAAKRRGVSLATLLAGHAVHRTLRFSAFAGALVAVDAAARARAAADAGAPAIKLKATGDLARELEALTRIVDAVGGRASLRLDLNGALGPREAAAALAAYASAGVALVEEPCSGRALLELGRAPIPWLADESLADPELAEALLASSACGGLVLKPMLLGLRRSLDLGRRAVESGKLLIVTHMFDGPVGLAAARAVALALPGEILPSGLEAHGALAAFGSALTEARPHGPGHGYELRHG